MPTAEPPVVTKHRHSNMGNSFEDVEHIVLEDKPDVALCGVDQTDVPWEQGFPRCAACLEVQRGGSN